VVGLRSRFPVGPRCGMMTRSQWLIKDKDKDKDKDKEGKPTEVHRHGMEVH
jgi:hypothetical protein